MMLGLRFKKFSFGMTLLFIAMYLVLGHMLEFGILQDMFTDIVLVVVFYFLLKSFLKANKNSLALIALLLALCSELVQFIQYVSLMEIEHASLAWANLTEHYHPVELLSYIFGYLLLITFNYLHNQYRLWKLFKRKQLTLD
ncbi:MAG: DUF2809 domain-containing protein [Parashewanella sp.]